MGPHMLSVLQVRKVSHLKDRSFVSCEDDVLVEAAVVLDATGFSRRLVEYDKPFNPGYQIAYGIVAEVKQSLLMTCVITCPSPGYVSVTFALY